MKIVYFLSFILLAFYAKAQNPNLVNPPTSAGSTFKLDTLPAQLMNIQTFWERNLHVDPAKNGAKPGKYTVKFSLLVAPDGKASDVRIEYDPGYGMGDDVLNALKNSLWRPAMSNGRIVNIRSYNQVTYQVDGDEDANNNAGDINSAASNQNSNNTTKNYSVKDTTTSTQNNSIHGKPLQDTAKGELSAFLNSMLSDIVKAEERDTKNEAVNPGMIQWDQNAKAAGLDKSGSVSIEKNLRKALTLAGQQNYQQVVFTPIGINKILILDVANRVGGLCIGQLVNGKVLLIKSSADVIVYPKTFEQAASYNMLMVIAEKHNNGI